MRAFKDRKIGTKLMALFLIVGLIPALAVASYSYSKSGDSLDKEAGAKLSAIMEIKRKQIEGWFGERMGDIKVLSSFYDVAESLKAYDEAFETCGNNSNCDLYKEVDRKFDKLLTNYQKEYGYYDLFLIHEDGQVVYSAEKEADFGTDLVNGQYRDSGLAKAFRTAMRGETALTDFEAYAPSNGVAASFVAAPVRIDGAIYGVVALQVPLSAINAIMQERTGLGESGETYLVGSDSLMRSDSRFSTESTVLKRKIATKGVEAALAGKSDIATYSDYRDTPVVGAYAPLKVAGLNWAIISEIDVAEVKMPLEAIFNATLVMLLIVIALVTLVAVAVARSMARPIQKMAMVAAELAQGDLDQQVSIDSRDEIGELGEAFQQMIDAQKDIANAAGQLAKGNMDVHVTVRSERDLLAKSMTEMRGAIQLLLNEMAHMSSEHDKGDIDVVVDAAKFEGAFNTVATGVNAMVNGHIAVKKKAMACIAEFGRGNFEASLEKFPGKKAFINDTIEQMRENLKALIADTLMLADSATNGKLDTRADAGKHDGDFRKIVQGVNNTLDAVMDPINEAAAVLEKLADRDLTARVVGDYKGDHAKIKQSLNNTAEALHDALAQVAEASEQVASAGNQIASSSQQVAEGASEQASSLEETSSSLEEMASMTKQNADNAQQANVTSKEARSKAENSSTTMGRMSQAMGQIRKAAEDTSAIIKDINEIAFQTNLLALNAAVEAARAGEAGRGFAVVAEEVRSLALRAKEAAQKTEGLIMQSVSLSEGGAKISDEVVASLQEILGAIGKVDGIVSEIATASQEQSRGIEQVNRAVAQMDQVTQQNAANSEESSSASQELSSQAQEMLAMIGRFRLSRSARAPESRSVAIAAPARKRTQKASVKAKAAHVGINVTPEDVIPLDSDPDFKNF